MVPCSQGPFTSDTATVSKGCTGSHQIAAEKLICEQQPVSALAALDLLEGVVLCIFMNNRDTAAGVFTKLCTACVFSKFISWRAPDSDGRWHARRQGW